MVTAQDSGTTHAMNTYFRMMPALPLNVAWEPGIGEQEFTLQPEKVDWNFTPTKFGIDLVDDATALDKMLYLDPDTRFDRLAANGFEPFHLDNVAQLSEEWLNNTARTRMYQLATEHAADGNDILPLLEAWLFDDKVQQMHRMQQLLTRYNFPDWELALRFAFCDAYQLAYAAYRVAEIDQRQNSQPPIDWSLYADQDRIAEDVRLADAGFDEEVARWPAY